MAQRAKKVEIPASVAHKILDDNPRRFYELRAIERANHIIKSRGCRPGKYPESKREKVFATISGSIVPQLTLAFGKMNYES